MGRPIEAFTYSAPDTAPAGGSEPAAVFNLHRPDVQEPPATEEAVMEDFRTLRQRTGALHIVFATDLEGTANKKNLIADSSDSTTRYLNPRYRLHAGYDVKERMSWNKVYLDLLNRMLEQDHDAKVVWASTLSLYEAQQKYGGKSLRLHEADASHTANQTSVLDAKLNGKVGLLSDEMQPNTLVVVINDDAQNGLPPSPHLDILRQKQPKASRDTLLVSTIEFPEFTGQKSGDPEYKQRVLTAFHRGLRATPIKLSKIPAPARAH